MKSTIDVAHPRTSAHTAQGHRIPLRSEQTRPEGNKKYPENATPNVGTKVTNLFTFIDLYKKHLPPSLSQSTVEKNARCIDTLHAYVGACDIDMRLAQTLPFVTGYGQMLRQQYSQATVTETLGDLRKIVRATINRRLIPNLDVFPTAIAAIQGDEAPKDFTTPLPVRQYVDTLLGITAKWISDRPLRQRATDPSQYRREREDDLNLRSMMLYLFGLLTYGIEITDIIALRRSDLRAGTLYIRRYQRALPLSPHAARLIYAYGTTYADDQAPLFDTLTDITDAAKVQKKADAIQRRVLRFLGERHIPLYTGRTAFDDWLSLSIECGLDLATADRLLLAGATGAFAPVDPADWTLANGMFLRRPNAFVEEWYMLRIFASHLNSSRLKRQLVATGLFGEGDEALTRLYDPIDVLACKDDNTGNPLGRFLFFKSTLYACSLINSMSRDAAVLRSPATRRFATIKTEELRIMMSALRDFRDDVELIDRGQWLRDNDSKLTVGGTVQILEGPLKGRTATIVDIKGATTTHRTYLLEFAEGNVTIKTQLQGLKLQPTP